MRELVIIGAGLAGLAAGKELQAFKPLILEKSRGLGGRLHSRSFGPAEQGVSADIGAQYFTARSPEFQAQVEHWQQQDIVTPWQAKIASWHQGQIHWSGPETRWVAQPKMQQIAKELALGQEIELSAQVESCFWLADQECWQIQLAQGRSLLSRRLLLTCPLDQAQQLLAQEPKLSHASLNWPSPMLPCISYVLRPAKPLVLSFDGLFVNDQPIAWLARNNSKPGRDSQELWVIHLGTQASQLLINHSLEARWQQLWPWLEQLGLGVPWQDCQALDCHLWRFARPAEQVQNAQQAFIDLPDQQLWLAGDWLSKGRVEGAWLSGRAAGRAILDHLKS